MAIAALITWVITALGGFRMLGTWIARGGARGGSSHLPVPVVLGHFALAALGLVVWVGHVITGGSALAWTAVGLLLPVALLGFLMFARWIPVYRSRAAAPARGEPDVPAERHFPVWIVVGHGLAAVVTLLLALITALGAGD